MKHDIKKAPPSLNEDCCSDRSSGTINVKYICSCGARMCTSCAMYHVWDAYGPEGNNR